MKKQLFLKVWIVLILLTIVSALVANEILPFKTAVFLILSLSAIKFLGVSFYFMELRKAHIFWKTSIVIYSIFISALIIILAQ